MLATIAPITLRGRLQPREIRTLEDAWPNVKATLSAKLKDSSL